MVPLCRRSPLCVAPVQRHIDGLGGQNRALSPASGSQFDVRRLEIPMNNTGVMRRF
jgi:hypothetical protein